MEAQKSGTAVPTPAPSGTVRPTQHGLSPRNLINVGVFAAIYFVVLFATGMIGMINPAMQIVAFAVGMFINGTVIMLFEVKTPVFGSMTVLGLITGILMTLTGHFWATILIATVLGALADLIVRSGHYRSRARNVLSYGVFQLWLIGPFLPVFYDNDGYRRYIADSMGDNYADEMMKIFSPATLVVLMAGAFLLSLFSAWVGTRVLDRNLSRAGVI